MIDDHLVVKTNSCTTVILAAAVVILKINNFICCPSIKVTGCVHNSEGSHWSGVIFYLFWLGKLPPSNPSKSPPEENYNLHLPSFPLFKVKLLAYYTDNYFNSKIKKLLEILKLNSLCFPEKLNTV